MLHVALSELKVGEQLGNLEYTIDSEALANYQLLLPRESRFPNIVADDCQTLLLSPLRPAGVKAGMAKIVISASAGPRSPDTGWRVAQRPDHLWGCDVCKGIRVRRR